METSKVTTAPCHAAARPPAYLVAKLKRDAPEIAEIHERACIRIGQLSTELDASKGGSNPEATLPALAEAGISMRKIAHPSNFQRWEIRNNS